MKDTRDGYWHGYDSALTDVRSELERRGMTDALEAIADFQSSREATREELEAIREGSEVEED